MNENENNNNNKSKITIKMRIKMKVFSSENRNCDLNGKFNYHYGERAFNYRNITNMTFVSTVPVDVRSCSDCRCF